jgi:hypothetical protein
MMSEIASYICSHVFHATRPVLLVAREEGDWMFLCGELHDEDERYHLVGMNHLLDRDPSLKDVLALPDHFEAEREAVGREWRWTPISDESPA